MTDKPELAVYTGESMHPTLREPDLMEIWPPTGQTYQPGDIILFHAPDRRLPVVHRVMAVTGGAYRTRGDNCPQMDPWLVTPPQVIGQVRAALQNDRRRALLQGQAGLWRARLRHAGLPVGRWLERLATGLLHRPYHALARLGLIHRLLPAGWRPYKVTFQSAGRPVARILLGSRVIGEYDSQRAAWRIRRPFRLLIDPHDLERHP